MACFDTSGHKVSFVTVEPDVQLEVLDWGGTGETLVLLTGLGDNAHVYDQFAYQFTDRFHVIGITRRGFGRSSQPAHGYDLDTRARDDIAVLDKLNIRQAVFVGHSVAGTELSKLGAAYPDRVKKLVYLDALDTRVGWMGHAPSTAACPGGYCRGSGIGAASCRGLGTFRRLPKASRGDLQHGPDGPLRQSCWSGYASRDLQQDPRGFTAGRVRPHPGSCARHFQSNHPSIPDALLLVIWSLPSKRNSIGASSRSRSGSKARSSASAPG